MTNLNALPQEVKERILRQLKAYDEVVVFYENGAYNFGVCLKAKYAPDHKYIGTYTAKEVYTLEERTINYIESFHEYPIWYKGKRDYKMLHEIEGDWSVTFKLDSDGNLVRK